MIFVLTSINSFRFEAAWARFRHRVPIFYERTHWLQAVDNAQPNKFKVFWTVLASDGLLHAKPVWYRYFGNIAAELEMILDGTFTVAKNGLPIRTIYRRNHPSWEDDAYAQQVLMLVNTA